MYGWDCGAWPGYSNSGIRRDQGVVMFELGVACGYKMVRMGVAWIQMSVADEFCVEQGSGCKLSSRGSRNKEKKAFRLEIERVQEHLLTIEPMGLSDTRTADDNGPLLKCYRWCINKQFIRICDFNFVVV